MRKLFLICSFAAILVSCYEGYNLDTQPIEKFYGKGYVIHRIYEPNGKDLIFHIKTPDTIAVIRVLKFDGERYKVGDTIK